MAGQWLNTVFTIAMQGILLLRAHALWNCSRKVLVVLLIIFVCETIVVVVVNGMLYNFAVMKEFIMSMGPSVGHVIEAGETDTSILEPWQTIYIVLELTFDTLLFIIALLASVKHTLEVKRMVKGWPINPLVKTMVADQIVYFILYAVWQAVSLPQGIPSSGAGYAALTGLTSLFSGFMAIAGPRMVISLRAQELKAREGTLPTELSTIQFDAQDLPSHSAASEEGPEPMAGHSHIHVRSSRHEVDAEY
ncbi:hypothetical protein BJ138DRAFT_1155385 [Hygrophoropsis aurantiaca]|uniref:Uncharacterized protein n=1 Tax=Hygrophoropsis aurantiaca TaxID=72124 RepID=A0ACB8A8I4_9AGAM|nr:hypothetical protein BJ138DRAFT_1155385 [Hygrophoropsis aurantiaca]